MSQRCSRFFLMLMVCLAVSVSADALEMKSLSRTLDPVIVSGSQCGLTGEPVENYGLYAHSQDGLIPIPFQIDEKDEDGEYILSSGKDVSQDNDKGLFDANDELVFMAMDTGDKISGNELLPAKKYTACAEIEVTDPVTKDSAWVYLMSFKAPQKKSPIDYVSYDDNRSSYKTRYHSGAYDKKHPVGPSKYTLEKALGGTGENLIDRVKVRVIIKSFGFTLKRSEEDITVEDLGYLDGPVRVIVHTKNTTPLALGIPASSTRQYNFFYDRVADFAFSVSFPIRPKYFRATIIDDFRDLRGWKFYNSNNPDGLVIDGKMGSADKHLDPSPWTWSVLTNGSMSFWSVWRTRAGCPVKASMYFNDNAEAEDKQEDIKGEVPGVGYDFNSGWKNLKADIAELRLIHFYTKGYEKGMETTIENVYDAPLTVSAVKL